MMTTWRIGQNRSNNERLINIDQTIQKDKNVITQNDVKKT